MTAWIIQVLYGDKGKENKWDKQIFPRRTRRNFLDEHELHELHEYLEERGLEDDAIFFQSLWVAEVEQEA